MVLTSPIEPHFIKLIEVVGVGSPEFSVVVRSAALWWRTTPILKGLGFRTSQSPQDPAAAGADLAEADDDEEEVFTDLRGFDVGDDDLPDHLFVRCSGCYDRRVHEVSGRA